jgi:hypothetical protein
VNKLSQFHQVNKKTIVEISQLMTRDRETVSNGLDKSGNNTSGPGYYTFYTEPNKQTKFIQFYTFALNKNMFMAQHILKKAVLSFDETNHIYLFYSRMIYTLYLPLRNLI